MYRYIYWYDISMKKLYLHLLLVTVPFFLIWCGSVWSDIQPEIIQDEIKEDPSPVTIHALWDSLTAWYQLPIQDSYPAQLEATLLENWYDITVLNWGISWDTSEWLLTRLDRQLETAKENDIALLVIWANDGLRGMPLDQMKANISSISETILEKWLFLIIGWMQIPLNNSPEYRAEFEQTYIDLCNSYKLNKKVSCVDFFLEWVWGIPERNLADGIHPTKEWYSIIVENIYPYVEKILQ